LRGLGKSPFRQEQGGRSDGKTAPADTEMSKGEVGERLRGDERKGHDWHPDLVSGDLRSACAAIARF
jgi:hypothetical protein